MSLEKREDKISEEEIETERRRRKVYLERCRREGGTFAGRKMKKRKL